MSKELMKSAPILKRMIHFKTQPKIYIISYPKAGRTWLRSLIGKSLSEKNNLPEDKILDTKYITVSSGLPKTSLTHDGSGMIERRKYSELPSDKQKYRYKKVLLLGRDIKDTLVSAYFQATKRIKIFTGSISDFIRSDRYGARKFITFYKQWHESRNVPMEFLYISYEEMHADTEDVLKKVLTFLGVPEIDDRYIKTAVDYSSFKNLKKAERENRFKASILSPGSIDDPESFKVRKGKIGNYIEYLSSDDIEYIDDLWLNFGCQFVDVTNVH